MNPASLEVPMIRESPPKIRHRPWGGHGESWNAIVTAREDRLPQARKFLRPLGHVKRTIFYNVLTMEVDEPGRLIDRIDHLIAEHPQAVPSLAHVFPAERCFDFSNPAEFESKARETALAWVPQLAGKTFHVRVHRRGRKGTLVSPDVERAVADALIAALHDAGSPARVAFDDPDAIVLIETIGGRAGMALLTRDDRRRHPLLATH
jgi:tRNA(Ser,Leu) C12 N-acetylase TAN1